MEYVNTALRVCASVTAAIAAGVLVALATYALMWVVSWLLVVLAAVLAAIAAGWLADRYVAGEPITTTSVITASVAGVTTAYSAITGFAARFTKTPASA